MRWCADDRVLEPRRYEIKYDPVVGYYLYVFEKNKCICDYLQSSLENTMDLAQELFGVDKGLWHILES